MFTSNSRWDRHLPSHSYDHEEPIEVGAIFRAGKIIPKWFTWKDRKYQVKEITFEWKDKRGDDSLHCFSLNDGANIYQVYFNNKLLHWRLVKICPLQ